MANDKNTANLKGLDTQDIVNELVRRLKLDRDSAETFKARILKRCGYVPSTNWEKPKNDAPRNSGGFFGNNDDDDDADDWDD